MVEDVRFFRNNKKNPHKQGTTYHTLECAQTLAITFRLQKNNYKYAMIPMHHTDCNILCPVRAWMQVISYLWNQWLEQDSSPVYVYWFKDGSAKSFTMEESAQLLKNSVRTVGSICSGFAIALVLGGTAVFEVMIIGHCVLGRIHKLYLKPSD